jgi:hypothetical protein
VAARSEIDARENPFPDEFGQAEQIVLHRFTPVQRRRGGRAGRRVSQPPRT